MPRLAYQTKIKQFSNKNLNETCQCNAKKIYFLSKSNKQIIEYKRLIKVYVLFSSSNR